MEEDSIYGHRELEGRAGLGGGRFWAQLWTCWDWKFRVLLTYTNKKCVTLGNAWVLLILSLIFCFILVLSFLFFSAITILLKDKFRHIKVLMSLLEITKLKVLQGSTRGGSGQERTLMKFLRSKTEKIDSTGQSWKSLGRGWLDFLTSWTCFLLLFT